jgi:hypothetical protein
MRDVASIKKGAYPENAEVISGRPTDEWTRHKAEHDWEAIQTENERAQKAVACGQLSEGLKQLRRESAEYKEKYDEYQSACSGEKAAPAPKRGDSGTSRRRDRKQGDPDKIMKNANEGSVF